MGMARSNNMVFWEGVAFGIALLVAVVGLTAMFRALLS